MNSINQQLNNIENKIQYCNCESQYISKTTVGWHIEHLLLTMNSIVKVLKESTVQNYKPKSSLLKLLVFTFKKIPRGKAKAPSFVTPKDFNEKSLKTHFETTVSNIKELEIINSNCYFSHPYFGDLKLKKAIQFIEIHNNHHIKIMDDIISMCNSSNNQS